MMANTDTTLHLFCGKIASGKSTLAAQLAEPINTIMLSEDRLLSVLYPEEIRTLADYARCSDRLRTAIGPLIVELLRNGTSAVLDFQANTQAVRAWLRGLIEATGVRHQLHFLQASDETCKRRLAARNADGGHQYQVSEADFELFTGYFVPPEPAEKFNVILHDQDGVD
jgi:predicted kinase